MKKIFDEITLEVITGDIASQQGIDVVVNAANAQLMPGAGVAGAIHRAAGPMLAEACRDIAPIMTGQAVITEAFNLPNRYIVHCLGPVYGTENDEELLASCYRSALLLADEHNAESIAFPAISTGVFGYPPAEAAGIALETVIVSLEDMKSIRHIRFVFFTEKDLEIFQDALSIINENHS